MVSPFLWLAPPGSSEPPAGDGWTNEQLQADPQGYLRWQEGQRTNAERERKEAQERSDFEQFAQMFVERGGDPRKSREM